MSSSSDPLELPAELRDRARDELNETPEVRQEGLRALRQRLEQWHASAEAAKEGPLMVPLGDDASLVAFLRPCKWNVDKAWGKIRSTDRCGGGW